MSLRFIKDIDGDVINVSQIVNIYWEDSAVLGDKYYVACITIDGKEHIIKTLLKKEAAQRYVEALAKYLGELVDIENLLES